MTLIRNCHKETIDRCLHNSVCKLGFRDNVESYHNRGMNIFCMTLVRNCHKETIANVSIIRFVNLVFETSLKVIIMMG